MAKIADILSLIKTFSPEENIQPDFPDNVGLLVGSDKGFTDKVIVCLDATECVIDEAAREDAKLVLAHHPVIFNPVYDISDKTPTGRTIIKAAAGGIAIYSAHTNVDFCDGGINDYNAELIGLTCIKPLEVQSGIAIGRVGELKQPLTLKQLTKTLREKFGDNYARYVGEGNEAVKRVAVINGGAGKVEYVEKAIAAGADCYISADFPHHVLLFARESGIKLVHLQHYCMEHIYINKWAELLNGIAKRSGVKVEFTAAASEANPTQTEAL